MTDPQDYNSIVEAIRLQLNVPQQRDIYNSIPMFIKFEEETLRSTIRAPQHIHTVTLTVERLADGQSRVEAPADLLEVINLRAVGPNGGFMSANDFSPYTMDTIEITNVGREGYLRILRAQSGDFSTRDYTTFDSAAYWFDSRYFYIAPAPENMQSIELVYYRSEPLLGTTANAINSDGVAVNAEGETMAQYLARVPSGTFVQDTFVVSRNWYTDVFSKGMVYGACLHAKPFLRSGDERLQSWAELYALAHQELELLIDNFEVNQPHQLWIQNTYSSNI